MSASGEFDIVALEPADAEGVAALHRQVMGEQDGWSNDGMRRLLAASAARGLQAKSAGGPEAFVLAFTAADEAEILALCVSPMHRRRGLARKLLRRLGEQLAAGHIGQLHLEVRQSNFAARELYSRCGFAESGRRRGYYRDGSGTGLEDAILMISKLSDHHSGA